jgi:hypothetical protein
MFNLVRKSVAVALVATFIFLAGCPSQSQLAALTQVLGSAAASIATLEGNPTLAVKLTTDTAAAVKAVQNWKPGTPTQDVVQVLNIVMDDLNLFPQVGPYAPLIVLAIGTVVSIIEILQPAPTGGAVVSKVHLVNAPKTAKEFKAQWNSLCAAHPEAKIK